MRLRITSAPLALLVVLACVIAAPAQRRHPAKAVNASPELRNKLAKALEGLTWESEGSDDPRVFFLPAAPGDAIDRVKAWAKKLPGPYRPEGYTTIETQTTDELFEGVLVPDLAGDDEGRKYVQEFNEGEMRTAAKWGALKAIIDEIADVDVFWIGSEINYQVIVVAGTDAHGNLVGIRMRHWSS